MPVIEPKYNFSTDRKNITVQFYYNEPVFDNENFNLSILFIDRSVAYNFNTIIEPKIVTKLSTINHSYLYFFLIAIIGGLILNVMPCVLPVLSLKLLLILNHQQKDYFSIRKSFFVTASGIIASFLLLAFVLIGLKLSGTSIGWGMQFQQPLFLMTIALVLFLFSLNLMGFFEFRLPYVISHSLSMPSNNKSFFSDFLNGFFATVLAVPCSAPFVGTAVSAAFTQSFLVMVGIFFFMGLGMAAPYIIAGIFPRMVYLLPRPGRWMNILKYFLAILLLGTLGWIGMILQNHFNYYFIIISFVLALIILISF